MLDIEGLGCEEKYISNAGTHGHTNVANQVKVGHALDQWRSVKCANGLFEIDLYSVSGK